MSKMYKSTSLLYLLYFHIIVTVVNVRRPWIGSPCYSAIVEIVMLLLLLLLLFLRYSNFQKNVTFVTSYEIYIIFFV